MIWYHSIVLTVDPALSHNFNWGRQMEFGGFPGRRLLAREARWSLRCLRFLILTPRVLNLSSACYAIIVCPSVLLTSNNFLSFTKDLNFTTLSILISSIPPLQLPLSPSVKIQNLLTSIYTFFHGTNWENLLKIIAILLGDHVLGSVSLRSLLIYVLIL